MHLVADANLALLDETFGQHGKITRVEGREITKQHLADADVLLLRSVTLANASLLKNTPVKFVGTATIGTDHLDIEWLTANNIRWASAPGCNADAAAQYALSMAWLACERQARRLRELTVGIVGLGNVGSRFQALLNALEIPSVACDPPLADAGRVGLVDLKQALSQPVISLHVPLTTDGPYPTRGMLNTNALEALPKHAILVNTSRGNVVKGDSLLAAIQAGEISAALDVWPGEPRPDQVLLDHSLVATPHVAGYSVEGRQRGTLMLYQAFCEWLDIEPVYRHDQGLTGRALVLDPTIDAVSQALAASCHVARDDHQMRQHFSHPSLPVAGIFDRLRREYPLRHDFCAWSISRGTAKDLSLLRAMGFKTPAEYARRPENSAA